MLNGRSTDQTAWDAAGFERLEERNPIDARGFHGNRLDAAVDEPVRQGVEICGVGTKSADDLLVVAVGHTGHDLMRANVDARGTGIDLAHAIERTDFTLGRLCTMAFAQLAHERLLDAITLDHLRSIACSSGSKPPVSDTCVIENHVAGRDASHQSIVGSQLVIASLYYTLRECEGTALFLRWGLPVRA